MKLPRFNPISIALLIAVLGGCRSSIPGVSKDMLSRLSGKIIANCPQQPDSLCEITFGDPIVITPMEIDVEDILSIALSSDRRYLAYAKIDRTDGISSLVVEQLDGNLEVKSTQRAGYVSGLSWSHDGTYIAYELSESRSANEVLTQPSDGSYCWYEVYMWNLEEPNAPHEQLALCATGFAWSPSSNKIALSIANETQTDTSLYLLDVETNQTALFASSAEPRAHNAIQWSPDGKRLSYVEVLDPAGSMGNLRILDIQSQGEVFAVPPEGCFWGSLHPPCYAWSSTGDKLAYVGWTRNDRFALEDVYVLDLKSERAFQVTKTEEFAVDDSFDSLGIRVSFPIWLGNSEGLAFFWNHDQTNHLVVATTSGRISRVLEYQMMPNFFMYVP